MPVTTKQLAFYRDEGFLVLPGLFSREEAAGLAAHYMARRAEGPKPGDMGGDASDPGDPLNRFPRMIQMHAWDAETARWAADPRLVSAVAALLRDTPVLNQTMLYFKPPGGRGQALHQDQQYITLEPLLGAWVALDDADGANGQMVVVPGSHHDGLQPVEEADPAVSFTGGQTRLPEAAAPMGLDMQAGDTLFFHGKLIHGSHPNTTADRFRRSFICHFVGKHAVRFNPPRGTHMTHLVAR